MKTFEKVLKIFLIIQLISIILGLIFLKVELGNKNSIFLSSISLTFIISSYTYACIKKN